MPHHGVVIFAKDFFSTQVADSGGFSPQKLLGQRGDHRFFGLVGGSCNFFCSHVDLGFFGEMMKPLWLALIFFNWVVNNHHLVFAYGPITGAAFCTFLDMGTLGWDHLRCYTGLMLRKAWARGGAGMFTFLERNPNVLITCYLVFQHISGFRK